MEIDLSPDIPAEIQQAKMRYGIVGNSPALIAALQRAVQVAPIDLSVLINGESGTGKEFFPKIIHNFSSRKHARYIAVNCGAIPEGTIDSELFGHEKGAFTGAVATRKGYFEEADGGTVFLDEVAELPLTTQARLLRVLESGEFMKVGSSTVQRTNIRIVAATNVDMARAVAEGKFREDLYYRLSTVLITLPPLRDRGKDIILLARKFASDFAERYRTRPITLEQSARDLIMHYRWPGNVRQLKNVIDQVSLFEAGENVDDNLLKQYLPSLSESYTPAVINDGGNHGGSHRYEHERELLFNMIFKMQGEIRRLTELVEGNGVENVTAVTADDVTAELHKAGAEPVRSLVKYDSTLGRDLLINDNTDTAPRAHTLEETERETIRRSLERNNGRRKATARELNISERTLYRKIKEYGLED